jgi:hypothetical protein
VSPDELDKAIKTIDRVLDILKISYKKSKNEKDELEYKKICKFQYRMLSKLKLWHRTIQNKGNRRGGGQGGGGGERGAMWS